ncbi:hypothetical protein EDD86DRAFT_48352 [Gorgonomyces haynaldii]|nr:hypothetical protein EDD86DRAFT_48352 [Gorgonomyces haynaldii]
MDTLSQLKKAVELVYWLTLEIQHPTQAPVPALEEQLVCLLKEDKATRYLEDLDEILKSFSKGWNRLLLAPVRVSVHWVKYLLQFRPDAQSRMHYHARKLLGAIERPAVIPVPQITVVPPPPPPPPPKTEDKENVVIERRLPRQGLFAELKQGRQTLRSISVQRTPSGTPVNKDRLRQLITPHDIAAQALKTRFQKAMDKD